MNTALIVLNGAPWWAVFSETQDGKPHVQVCLQETAGFWVETGSCQYRERW